MTEPLAVYTVESAADPVPRRALNLARRLLQLEADSGGRCRITIDIIMLDGEWLMGLNTPGKLERLGE